MKNKKQELIRLIANENFYGSSPGVLRALKKNLKNMHLYPAPPLRLEEKIAKKFGVEQNNIVIGGGSVRLIDGIVQTLVEPDEEIIIFERSFVAYEQIASSHRRKYLLAKQNNFVCDVKNIIPLISPKTKVIFVANPNNPTGTIINHTQLEYLLKKTPKKVFVVVDEAYCEYVTDKAFPDSISLQKKYSNLIILRTFSKVYGLAGLRIGYSIANEKISDSFKQSRIPFFFNPLSEDAALAALADEKFVKKCVEKNSIEREFLYQNLKKLGFKAIPSQGNFIYLFFDDDNEKEIISNKLLDAGLLICNLKMFGQDKSIRISIGNRSANKKIVACLKIGKDCSKTKNAK